MAMSNMNYSDLLKSVRDELGNEFKPFRSAEEYRFLRERLMARLGGLKEANHNNSETQIYSDPKLRSFFAKLRRLLATALPEKENELPLLPEIIEKKAQFHALLRAFDAVAAHLKPQAEIDASFMNALSCRCAAYKSSEDYIRRLVIRRLAQISPEFVCQKNSAGEWETDASGNRILRREILQKDAANRDVVTTRLLILKQLIKQFHWCEGVEHEGDKHGDGYRCERLKTLCETGFGGNWERMTLEMRDDAEVSVFHELKLKKKLNREHKLVKDQTAAANNLALVLIAKDFASGFFGSKASTREGLYVFALAFEMTFSLPAKVSEKGDADYDTDIRKNLFFDFYTDSLTNTYNRDARTERYVSGYGINYKNFVEISYLYALQQREDELEAFEQARELRRTTPALSRFIEARTLINECKASSEAQDEEDVDISKLLRTSHFESFFSGFKSLPYEAFKKELLRVYAIRSEDASKDLDVFEGNITAGEVYYDLLKCLSTVNRREHLVVRGFGEYYPSKAKAVRAKEENEETKSSPLTVPQLLRRLENADAEIFDSAGNAVPPEGRDVTILYRRFKELLDKEAKLRKRLTEINAHTLRTDPKALALLLNRICSDEDLKLDEHALVVARSDLMIIACVYLCVAAEKKTVDALDRILLSFQSFYKYMQNEARIPCKNVKTFFGLNDLLLECGFMEVHHKNLFDMMLLYFTYQRLVTKRNVKKYTADSGSAAECPEE